MGKWLSRLGHAACVAFGAALIAASRGTLLEAYSAATSTEEVSLLLTPEYTVVLTLGHRDAAADYLFANLLVKYGMSFQEQRRFEATYNYLDTITTLAPKYIRPYLYVDTLLTMRPKRAVLEDFLGARRLQERGLHELPYATELWNVAGQFAAYLAPQYLPEQYKQEFKLAGARDLMRACELASNNTAIPYHCITAAKLLNRAGERDAVVRMLQNTLAVTDDPAIRKLALGVLDKAANEKLKEQASQRVERVEQRWKEELPHASRAMMSLLGPGPDLWRCTGALASGTEGCHTTWLGFAPEPSGSGT